MRSDVFALPLCMLRALFSLTHTVMGEAVLTPADWTQSLMGISFHMVQLYLHGAALNLVLHMRTSTLIQLNTKSRSESLIKLLEDREQPELSWAVSNCREPENKKHFEGFWWDLERFQSACRHQGLTSPLAKQNTLRSMQLQLQSKGMSNFQAYLHSQEGPPFNPHLTLPENEWSEIAWLRWFPLYKN